MFRSVAIIFACTFTSLAGCSMRPSFQTEMTAGKVISATEISRGPSGPVTQTVVVPFRGIYIPIPITLMQNAPRSYLYAINTNTEAPVVTQSSSHFAVGACVRLWHAPLAPATNSDYNFVSGTLERGISCP
jgi:hypothetical protein